MADDIYYNPFDDQAPAETTPIENEERVEVIDSNTKETGTIPRSQIEAAKGQGVFETSSPEGQKILKEEKFGTAGQQLQTAVEGVAEGLSAGLIPLATDKLGLTTVEEREARKEVNPVAAGGGEVVGVLGSVVSGAGVPALLMKGGQKVLGSAAKKTLAGKLVQSVVREGGEAAGYGLIQEASDEIAKNEGLSAEKLLAATKDNFLLGGGAGGVLTGIGAGVSKVWRGGKELAQSAATKIELPTKIDDASTDATLNILNIPKSNRTNLIKKDMATGKYLVREAEKAKAAGDLEKAQKLMEQAETFEGSIEDIRQVGNEAIFQKFNTDTKTWEPINLMELGLEGKNPKRIANNLDLMKDQEWSKLSAMEDEANKVIETKENFEGELLPKVKEIEEKIKLKNDFSPVEELFQASSYRTEILTPENFKDPTILNSRLRNEILDPRVSIIKPKEEQALRNEINDLENELQKYINSGVPKNLIETQEKIIKDKYDELSRVFFLQKLMIEKFPTFSKTIWKDLDSKLQTIDLELNTGLGNSNLQTIGSINDFLKKELPSLTEEEILLEVKKHQRTVPLLKLLNPNFSEKGIEKYLEIFPSGKLNEIEELLPYGNYILKNKARPEFSGLADIIENTNWKKLGETNPKAETLYRWFNTIPHSRGTTTLRLDFIPPLSFLKPDNNYITTLKGFKEFEERALKDNDFLFDVWDKAKKEFGTRELGSNPEQFLEILQEAFGDSAKKLDQFSVLKPFKMAKGDIDGWFEQSKIMAKTDQANNTAIVNKLDEIKNNVFEQAQTKGIDLNGDLSLADGLWLKRYLYDTINFPQNNAELAGLKKYLQTVSREVQGKILTAVEELDNKKLLSFAQDQYKKSLKRYGAISTSLRHSIDKISSESMKSPITAVDTMLLGGAAALDPSFLAVYGLKKFTKEYQSLALAMAHSKNPQELGRLAQAGQVLKSFNSKMNKAIDGFVSGAKNVRSAAPYSVAVLGQTKQEEKKNYEKNRVVLTDLMTDNNKLQKYLEEKVFDVKELNPRLYSTTVAKAANALTFLKSKLPQDMLASKRLQPQLSQYQPTDIEMIKFKRYLSAVDNPLSVMDDLQKGIISTEGVETLKAVYPELFNEIKSKIMVKLSELKTELPYAKRLQLSMLFGVPLEPSLDYNKLQQLQQNFAPQEPQQNQGVRRPSAKTMENKGNSLKSPVEGIFDEDK